MKKIGSLARVCSGKFFSVGRVHHSISPPNSGNVRRCKIRSEGSFLANAICTSRGCVSNVNRERGGVARESKNNKISVFVHVAKTGGNRPCGGGTLCTSNSANANAVVVFQYMSRTSLAFMSSAVYISSFCGIGLSTASTCCNGVFSRFSPNASASM